MGLIHLEPEQLRSVGSALQYDAAAMYDSIVSLRGCLQQIDMNWDGGAVSDQWIADLRQALLHLDHGVNELYVLCGTFNRQADLWEESDQVWKSHYRELTGSK